MLATNALARRLAGSAQRLISEAEEAIADGVDESGLAVLRSSMDAALLLLRIAERAGAAERGTWVGTVASLRKRAEAI